MTDDKPRRLWAELVREHETMEIDEQGQGIGVVFTGSE